MTEKEWEDLFAHIRETIKNMGLSKLEDQVPDEVFEKTSKLDAKEKVMRYLESIKAYLKLYSSKIYANILNELNLLIDVDDKYGDRSENQKTKFKNWPAKYLKNSPPNCLQFYSQDKKSANDWKRAGDFYNIDFITKTL